MAIPFDYAPVQTPERIAHAVQTEAALYSAGARSAASATLQHDDSPAWVRSELADRAIDRQMIAAGLYARARKLAGIVS